MKNTEIWIGRLDIKPRAGNDSLGNAKGAVVNVVALASDEKGFAEIVTAAMEEHAFDILRCEDVARLSDWRTGNKLHHELESLAHELTPEFPIQFDEFQSYLDDDA